MCARVANFLRNARKHVVQQFFTLETLGALSDFA